MLYWALPSQAKIPQNWVLSLYIADEGVPLEGGHDLVLRVLDQTVRGRVLLERRLAAVLFDEGAATVSIEVTALAALGSESPRYLSVIVDGREALPRVPIASVPAATRVLESDGVEFLGGVTVVGIPVIDEDGQWVGPAIEVGRTALAGGAVDELAQRLIDLTGRAEDTAAALGEQRIRAAALAADAAVVADASGVAEQNAEILWSLFEGVSRTTDGIAFEALDVHVRSGLGSTYHSGSLGALGAPNGLGNVIIGYDEDDGRPEDATTGSHNLVVGPGHTYQGFGALLVGRGGTAGEHSAGALVVGLRGLADAHYAATIAGEFSSAEGAGAVVIGGRGSAASGVDAIVVGGAASMASGARATAVGGVASAATGASAVAIGGQDSDAAGESSVVVAGLGNATEDDDTVAIGGAGNLVDGDLAVAAGGSDNRARGYLTVTVGGQNNEAFSAGDVGAVALGGGGPRPEDGARALGEGATTAGGRAALATDQRAVALGGDENWADGEDSVVLGGSEGYGEEGGGAAVGGRTQVTGGALAVGVGGEGNEILGDNSFVIGGGLSRTCDTGVGVAGAYGSRPGHTGFCLPARAASCATGLGVCE
jgi:hypothetical protein